jgi:hypothetical protein
MLFTVFVALPVVVMSKKWSTVTGWRGVVITCVFIDFSLFVSHYRLSVAATLMSSLFAIFASWLVVRVIILIPDTFKTKNSHFVPEFLDAKDFAPLDRKYQLIAMPINHFGEKVRWCLDLVGADYEEITVGGILSATFRGRSVPWLVDKKACTHIGNSDEILFYLSAVHVPTITDPIKREKCKKFFERTAITMEWEVELNAVGHAVQGTFTMT